MRLSRITLATLCLSLPVSAPSAQASTLPRDAERRARAEVTVTRSQDGRVSLMSWDSDRAYLGISTGGGSKRDTLGLLIEGVVPGSPADKAGLEEGNRIASINGVKLTADAADAGEPETASMMQRRLTRELGKVKQGDDVEMRVWTGGQVKAMKVKTGSPEDPIRVGGERLRNRAVLGLGLGSTGSRRDTLGVFISSVTDGGPADKAGIGEGDRIAAIDGTDLRVPREDAGDGSVSSSRVSRLQRMLRAKNAGDEVQLRVWSNGRYRDVKVKTARASDLGGAESFRFYTGDDEDLSFFRTPMPAMAPMAPMTPMTPMAPREPMSSFEFRFPGAPTAPRMPAVPLLRGLVRSRTVII